MNLLWNISDCQVERVGALISKKSELCFVCGYNNWDNCCARFLSFKFFLYRTKVHDREREQRSTKVTQTCVDHHHRPVCISWYILAAFVSLVYCFSGANTRYGVKFGSPKRALTQAITSRKYTSQTSDPTITSCRWNAGRPGNSLSMTLFNSAVFLKEIPRLSTT